MLSKKGILLVTAVTLIIAFFTIGIVGMLMFTFFSESNTMASDWICKTSVGFSHGTFSIPKKLELDTIYCYTNKIKSDAETKDEVVEDIAEHMRKCWVMWGEGKLNPEGKNIWRSGEDKCFTCYKLIFPDLKENEKISLNDIFDYLQDDDVGMEEKLEGERSYWNYFKRNNPDNYAVILSTENKDKDENIIEKNKFYAVTYLEGIEPSRVGHILTWGGAFAVIGAVAGATSGGAICSVTIIGTPVCAFIGGTLGGVAGSVLDYVYLWSWDKLHGGPVIDAIQFIDYDNAKENCVTVEKV